MRADELREKYLNFFQSKGCVRRPSDVLVPRWDPSVLFTPAGMNQFKDHFLGRCKLEFTRATTCQKCLRTGDIENVGRTAYHHTFFEMLGNFSFGDYFKREAIHWAWEFLTDAKWLGLAPERLSATVYHDDDEAAAVWSEIGLPAERVGRLGEDENFWPANAPSQGPDGVCGPCSEIYYHTDFGDVEIWNLVFTQFNRVGPPPDNLRPLPSKNIDTGMGFERTAAVLQNVETNFHIDILLPIVQAAAEVCRMTYEPQSENGRRLRRITDHVRACTFAIHENVQPGPKKQGYVVKRLLRRAVLDGHQMGVREPFLHKLVGMVAQMMKQPYPELQETADRVAKVVQAEEENFLGTIDAGLDRIRRMFQQMAAENRAMVSGEEAAEMFQTHGFPPELFEAMAAERNLLFDWDGFRRQMEQHGIDSGGGKKVELFTRSALDAIRTVNPPTRFLGYDALVETDAKVIGIIASGQLVDALDEIGHDRPVVVVLDKTPFYGEMGGQVGDVGEIVAAGLRFEVVETTIEHGFIQHHGHLRQGSLSLAARVTARVDEARRQAIRRAHSATHLLHLALHEHVGKHALQQGSKVDRDLLRFDFANPKGLTAEQLAAVEDEVNRLVMAGMAVACKNLPLAEARKLGAMMLFGEKYPDMVRVVSMGQSKELCGGTHLDNTGQIGLLKIVAEESVAAGVRRITALTGPAALEHVHRIENALAKTSSLLKVSPEEVPARVESLVKEVRELKKKSAAAPKSGGPTVQQLLAEAADVGGVRVVIAEVPEATPQSLRDLIDQFRRKVSPSAVLLATRQDGGKVLLVAGVSRDLVAKGIDAVKWVTVAARQVGGGGGGRPDLAQAGGKDAAKLPEAFDAARKEIETLLAP
jgi:alanyl-tRNA synthetase